MAGVGVVPKYEGAAARNLGSTPCEVWQLVGLFLQHIEDGLAERDKFRVGSLARMRKVDGKDVSHPAWPRFHQDEAVRQENRLFDVMRHHDDGDIFMFP